MKKSAKILLRFFLLTLSVSAGAQTIVNLTDFGIRPGKKTDMAQPVAKALQTIKARYGNTGVTLRFAPGEYQFHESKCLSRKYFISNHDQTDSKRVAIAIENWDNVTIEADSVEFTFHGTLIPIAVVNSANVTLKGFSVDFATPHISQATIIANDENGIEFEPAPWVRHAITPGTHSYETRGEGWVCRPRTGIAFNPATRHVIYNTADLWIPLDSVIPTAKNRYLAPRWRDKRLTPGTVVAMRDWGRPTPGIFLSQNRNTSLLGVHVRYSLGMGLLAQLCDTVTLDGFGVCLRGDTDPRYFTTQADATHFSGCKGLITSINGLYEGMMDDAINVHGTYLKVIARTDSHTLRARYMHKQSYGFPWGEPGDSVQAISAPTMENFGPMMHIASITPVNDKDFDITFTTEPDSVLTLPGAQFGLENLSWCPAVNFSSNTIRNNRARGALFSTPRPVVVANNIFDHTSGAAILLCGDCMGWYETGACHDVTIRGNKFINALTSRYQFTEAVISIYPEIHNLANQQLHFHSGILIEDNIFNTFPSPLLYAKSTSGLIFRNNRIIPNQDFPPFHPNRFDIKLERSINIEIYGNSAPNPLSTVIL